MDEKQAFTLAEVLVTLAIIGVVAALTIPTVVAKYQKAQYYTQFMKAYNTLYTAISLSVAENGTPDTWGCTSSNSKDVIIKNIQPYLKVNKVVSANDYIYYYSTLSGSSKSISGASFINYFLNDGLHFMALCSPSGPLLLYIDTNGDKGPNVLGRDFFGDLIYKKVDGKWILTAIYTSTTSLSLSNCKGDGTNVLDGASCAARLLLEGKMNY